MARIESINRNEEAPLKIDMDDENVITLASLHMSALTHALVEPKKDAVELTNSDVAALLWPLKEILNAAANRSA